MKEKTGEVYCYQSDSSSCSSLPDRGVGVSVDVDVEEEEGRDVTVEATEELRRRALQTVRVADPSLLLT